MPTNDDKAQAAPAPAAEPPEDPQAAPAPAVVANDDKMGAARVRRLEPKKGIPKPRFKYDCEVTFQNRVYEYPGVVGFDPSDCKRILVDRNPAFAGGITKLRFSAKRVSNTPVNADQLTKKQLAAVKASHAIEAKAIAASAA